MKYHLFERPNGCCVLVFGAGLAQVYIRRSRYHNLAFCTKEQVKKFTLQDYLVQDIDDPIFEGLRYALDHYDTILEEVKKELVKRML